MTRRSLWLPLAAVLSSGMFLAGCGGGGSSGSATGGTGTLSLYLTDAASLGYRAVYVTIREVQVHLAGEQWSTAAAPNRTYNLLELINGVLEPLGTTELPAGEYTQMRLLLGSTPDGGRNLLGAEHPYANYVILREDDSARELQAPSGPQTGLKVVGGFRIQENVTLEMILDFDAARSVVRAGQGGQWLLKPTVKVLQMVEKGVLWGRVAEAATSDPVSGALVTTQTAEPGPADPAAGVTVQAGTLTSADGEYHLFLADNRYQVVAFAAGYGPACAEIDIGFGESVEQGFALGPAASYTVSGTVSLPGAAAPEVVTLSFRKTLDCANGNGPRVVEIVSDQVLAAQEGTPYSQQLPPGEYTIVASSPGRETHALDVPVPEGGLAGVDISL